METLRLASGFRIPALGLGTWQLNGKRCREAVRDALDLGYTHIDTASVYRNQGDIGEAIRGADRSGLFITSKVWRSHLHYRDLVKEFHKTLKELGTDYLDLYLIHWPNRKVPVQETLDAMRRLVENGRIRSIGVSNFTISHLEKAMEVSRVPLSVNQVEYHPYLNQEKLLDFCRSNKILITAYSPLARVRVMGDKTLSKTGEDHGKSPAQVSLRWLLQKGMAAIPKAGSREHLQANMGVFGWRLSRKEMKRIDGIGIRKRLVDPFFSEFTD